ncbi:MAG TPA: YetF domain-containing protein [Gemmatimonadaceae bacterium]
MQHPLMPHPPYFFESWYNVIRTVTLSIIGFAALMILLRGSGKRTLSKLNAFDFVFVVAVGSVFASTIISKDITLVEGVASMTTLIVIQVTLAELAMRFPMVERIINGKPTLLLSHGQFIPRALKKERVTEEEVRGAIRAKGVNRVEDVDAVILENDGSLSVAWEAKGPGRSSLVDATVPEGARAEESSRKPEKSAS